MSSITPKNQPWQVLLVGSAILAIALPFISLKPIFILFLILIYYLSITLFINNKIGLYFLIFLRPVFDLFYSEPIMVFGQNIKFSFIIGGITLLFAGYIVYKNFSKFKELPLLIPVFLFLLIAFASSFTSGHIATGLTECFRLLSIFSLFALGFILTDSAKDFIRIIKIIAVSAIIPSIVALYQFITKTGMSLPFEGIYNRIYGTFAHPNLFAYYLVISITITLFIFLISNRKRINNMMFIALMPFFITMLILTFTRGAWLALLMTVALIGVIKFRKLLVISFFILLVLFVSSESINTRVKDLIPSNNQYSSIDWRIRLWQDSINYVQEEKILGHGTGFAKELILQKRGESFGSSDPHNDYLKIALENGYLGLGAYLLIILSLFFHLLKKYRATELANFKIMILLTIGLTFSLYTMSFADNILRNTALEWSYWALIGGLFAIPTAKAKTVSAENVN